VPEYNLFVKCPHCLVEFHDHPESIYIDRDVDGYWGLVKRTCPACQKISLILQNGAHIVGQVPGAPCRFAGFQGAPKWSLIHPKGSNRPPCPLDVPKQFAGDYAEACLVLPDSAKAAAALGRRCLQNLLRDHVGIKVKGGNLADEIQEVIDSNKLPSDLSDQIDAIRNVGNFSAHPMKSQSSGQILDVEPGEAEWTLDVLEELFDFYFVRPAQRQKKRVALDQKLKDAGKPAMK
jgi:hypothetical protein